MSCGRCGEDSPRGAGCVIRQKGGKCVELGNVDEGAEIVAESEEEQLTLLSWASRNAARHYVPRSIRSGRMAFNDPLQ